MAGAEILKSLFDEKKIKVLQEFIQKPTEEQTLQEITKTSKVPLATTFRILKLLVEENILEKKKLKHLTLYKLSTTDAAKYLIELFYEQPKPLEQFADLIKNVEEIDQIIMHGEATESSANVVVIGQGISPESVNAAVATIREDLNYRISHLVLEPEQFGMLEQMGQFSGNRTILFSK